MIDPEHPSALVGPPVAPALHVLARSIAEVGGADDDDLEAVGPGLVTSPGAGRDPHRVPFLELDDRVVELHPPAPAHDHVDLLLRLVGVAVRKPVTGRNALIAQAGSLEPERPGRHSELQIRRTVEVGPDVLEVMLEVAERERHDAGLPRRAALRRSAAVGSGRAPRSGGPSPRPSRRRRSSGAASPSTP